MYNYLKIILYINIANTQKLQLKKLHVQIMLKNPETIDLRI